MNDRLIRLLTDKVYNNIVNLQEKKKNKSSGKLTDYQKKKYKMKPKAKNPLEKRRTAAQKNMNRKRAKGKKITKKDYERIEKANSAIAKSPGFKNVPRSDSKTSENKKMMLDRKKLRKMITESFLELLEAKRKRSKKKKASKTLSKKTKETLKKKAQSKGYTPGSVYAEYRRGLGAYYSSGSRPGMSPHQWAMARVNSALQGGKSWANVKKSKSK